LLPPADIDDRHFQVIKRQGADCVAWFPWDEAQAAFGRAERVVVLDAIPFETSMLPFICEPAELRAFLHGFAQTACRAGWAGALSPCVELR
jgi:hypothetical protein